MAHLSGGEGEAQPFRRPLREAARRLREAAERAVEAPARIAEMARAPAKREGGPGEPVPFRRRPRRPQTPGRLRGSPLEGRAAAVLVYNTPPSSGLSGVAGARRACSELERLAANGVGRVLIAGPPGVGKSVLALAYAAELGRGIIDVDAGGLAREDDPAGLLGDVVEEARRGDYTLVVYNAEGLIDPRLAGRVIIYDPYTPLTSGRVIIYDPYTDSTPSRAGLPGETPLASMVEGAARDGLRVVATATSPWLLPRSFVEAFEATVSVPLPSLEDRVEILENLLAGATLGAVKPSLLAALTAGASVADLVALAESIAGQARRQGALTLEDLAEILTGTRNTGASITNTLYTQGTQS